MSGQWKPGDVAMVELPQGGERVSVLVGHDPSARCWHSTYDNGDLRCLAADAVAARPLVVIDPADGEAVKRLANARQHLWDSDQPHTYISVMQAALREVANSTPPKPDEPHGLGAVVRDAQNGLWIRTCYPCDNCLNKPWQRGPVHRNWQIVDAVEVLAEGYDQGAGEPLADWERDFLRGES